jgi:hypothetical protein
VVASVRDANYPMLHLVDGVAKVLQTTYGDATNGGQSCFQWCYVLVLKVHGSPYVVLVIKSLCTNVCMEFQL